MSTGKKVLLIGLDGFTWYLGRELMAEGVMPNLAQMLEEGCHGDLLSVVPFETAPAWSAMMTGCRPGKTGIFTFHTYDRTRRKVRLNSLADNAMPSIWQLCNQAGKTVVNFNMPVTSPPVKVKGVFIPGLLCPGLSPQTVYPPEAYEKYIAPHPDYRIINKNPVRTPQAFMQKNLDTERVRFEIAHELLKDVDWDLFFLQIQCTDAMQHELWWTLDKQARGYDPLARTDTLRFYRFCDDQLGTIFEQVGRDVLTIIISDHGFQALEKTISINVWLRQHGYLQMLPQPPQSNWEKWKNRLPPLKYMARRLGPLWHDLTRKEPAPLHCETNLKHMRQLIDFEKTTAFCLGCTAGLIYINGTSQQRGELAQKIKTELLADLGPQARTAVLAGIRTGRDVYGPTEDENLLPDLVLDCQPGVNIMINMSGDEVIRIADFAGKQHGTHAPQGIWAARGNMLSQGEKFDGELVDIMPNVLAYLGIDIPRHVDGKVWEKLFREMPQIQYADFTGQGPDAPQYSEEEQKVVEQHLADLGYL